MELEPRDIKVGWTVGSLSQDPLTPVSQEKETEALKGKATYPIAPRPSLTLTTFQVSIIRQRTSLECSFLGDTAF